MGDQNQIGCLDVRWLQCLFLTGLAVAYEIGVDQQAVLTAFNSEPGSAKPCEFHVAPIHRQSRASRPIWISRPILRTRRRGTSSNTG